MSGFEDDALKWKTLLGGLQPWAQSLDLVALVSVTSVILWNGVVRPFFLWLVNFWRGSITYFHDDKHVVVKALSTHYAFRVQPGIIGLRNAKAFIETLQIYENGQWKTLNRAPVQVHWIAMDGSDAAKDIAGGEEWLPLWDWIPSVQDMRTNAVHGNTHTDIADALRKLPVGKYRLRVVIKASGRRWLDAWFTLAWPGTQKAVAIEQVDGPKDGIG